MRAREEQMRNIIATGLLIALAGHAGATTEQVNNRHLENLSGCFEVSYRFAEDGVHGIFSEEYGLDTTMLEWIGLDRPDAESYRLTHVAILENRVMSHFHEIWRHHPEKRTWQQSVWRQRPGDTERQLRYDCTAAWEQNLWSCRTGKAEKPFRDSGAPFGFDRTDYDYLDRHNTLLVTPEGWVHSQHNRKKRESGEVVAQELGWITYERVDDEKRCERGRDWLEKQGPERE
jgi:hypothetical protein